MPPNAQRELDEINKIRSQNTKTANDGVKGFVYNINTLKNAKGVAVLSFVKGKSGKLDLEKDDYATLKAHVWEVFDAGIAC